MSELTSPVAHPVAVDASVHDMLRMMDIASMLRRERETAEAWLDVDAAKVRLRERLLATAAAAGEAVTTAEVDAAIDLYFGSQHRYEDPPAGWATFWAHVWVLRSGIALLFALAVVLVVGSWLLAGALAREAPPKPIEAPAASGSAPQSARPVPVLPEPSRDRARFDELLAVTRAMAADADAQGRVARLATAADGLREGASPGSLLSELQTLHDRLAEQYEVRVVTRPGERSGVDRYGPDGRLSGYYVVVEAVDGGGRVLPRQVRNAETGRTERVTKWGELVDADVWQRLVADKQADGVLDEALFASKQRGVFDERVVLVGGDGRPVQRRRQITSW